MAENDIIHPHLDATPLSRVWSFKLPGDFIEPEAVDGYSPIAPTPIVNSSINPWFHEVMAHERMVAEAYRPLFNPANAPGLIPDRMADMIQLNQLTGEARRSTNNLFAYSEWCRQHDSLLGLPPDQAEHARLQAIENEVTQKELGTEHAGLLMGKITPQQGLAFLRGTSLPSCELAKVTHPYGYRMGFVKEARVAVTSAILAHEGTIIPPNDTPYQKITFQPHLYAREDRSEITLDGFLVTYKRPVGYCLDEHGRRINVIERQSAAIRVDPGAMDLHPRLSELLRKPLPRDGEGNPLIDELRKHTLYDEYFGHAIQRDADVDYLVPLSTMTYAARETEAEYENRLKEQAASAHKIGRTTLSREE